MKKVEQGVTLEEVLKNYTQYHFALVDVSGAMAIPLFLGKTKKEAIECKKLSSVPCGVISLDNLRKNVKKQDYMNGGT